MDFGPPERSAERVDSRSVSPEATGDCYRVGPAQLTSIDENSIWNSVISTLNHRFSLSKSAISEHADQLATLGRTNR